MAIGAHELLLIVRAQNQASALLGRVGRDVRRLQNLRDINMQRAALMNRQARIQMQMTAQQARIQSVMAADGKIRLQNEQAIARNALQQYNVNSRITNLDVRRTGLDRARAGIEVQRLNLLRQEEALETRLARTELRRQTLNAQIGKLGTQQLRNASQQEQLTRQAHALDTQVMQRELRARQARRTADRLQRAGVGGTPLADARTRQVIAQRQLAEARMAVTEVPGRRAILAGVGGDIQAQIRTTQTSLSLLKNEEREIAAAANVVAQRHAVLAAQIANVDARTVALDSAEGQLIRELAILENELGIINARWREQVAATGTATESLAIYSRELETVNAQLAENAALQQRQNAERRAGAAQAVAHTGRVAQITGLVTTAAFAAMAVSAAKFNTEAVRASTQVGRIGSNASTVVANAGRIEKAIIGIMQVIPANQNDLTDALYNIYSSMNATFGQGTRLLKLFGQVWVAGGMTGNINDVADALITLGNNWGISARNMGAWQKLAASTLATVRFGRLTVEQYTQTMNQLAPAFHGAGQSIEQMNGAIAFMTRLMPSQRMSAAGLARLMEIIGRFAAKPAPGFEKLAKDIQDAKGNLIPLDQIIQRFIQSNRKLLTSGVERENFLKMISGQQGTVQARRALKGLIQNFDLYRDTLKNTTGDTKEFNRSLRAMQQSGGVRWAQFVNDMRSLGLELGAIVLPGLLKVAGALQDGVRWFNSLSQSTRTWIGATAASVAVGLLLVGTIAAIAGSFAKIIISYRILRGEAGGLAAIFGLGATSTKTLAGEAGSLAVKATIVTGALTALLFLLAKYPHQVGQVVDSLGGLQTVLEAITILIVGRQVGGLLKYASGIERLGAEAVIGAGLVGKLRGALYSLSRASPYIIAIVVSYTLIKGLADNLKKDAHNALTKAMASGLSETVGRIPVVGRFAEAGADAGEKFGNWFNRKVAFALDKGLIRSRAKVKAMTEESIKAATSPTGISMAQGIREANQILTDSAVPGVTKFQVQSDLTLQKWQAIHAVFDSIYNLIPNMITGVANLGKRGVATSQASMDEAYMRQLRQVAALQNALTGNYTLANYRKLQDALKKLNAKYNTDVYKGYTSDYLGRVNTAEKQAVRDRAKISKSQFFSELKNVVALRNAYLRSHSQADQQKFFEARKQLMKESSDSERQYLTESVSRTDAAYKKNLSAQKAAVTAQNKTYSDALSNLTQMYDQFFGEQQQNMGSLFQGPVLTGPGAELVKQLGGTPGARSNLQDLTQQVNQYEKFNRVISRLQARKGTPQALVDQLRAGGVSTLPNLEALAKSPEIWKKFVGVFNRGQADIKKAAMGQLVEQTKMFKIHGQNIMKAIIEGITMEDQNLQKALVGMLEKDFGIKKPKGYKPDSQKTNVNIHNHTTIHTGAPHDHRSSAKMRHALFVTRSHTAGRFG